MCENVRGHIPWSKGKHLTEEHRRKLSEAHKGTPGYNKGRKLSNETRERMSEAAKERYANGPHPCEGRELTQEHKDILRKANTGHKHTEETKIV